MGRHEGEHDVIAHIRHGIGHHGDHVPVVLDGLGASPEGDGGYQEDDKEIGDERFIERAQLIGGFDRRIPQRRIGPETQICPEPGDHQDGNTGETQAHLFPFGQLALMFRHLRHAHAGLPGAKARFDETIRHEPDDRYVEDQHHGHEPPVAGDVRGPGLIEDLGPLFRDAEEERIELTRQEIGGEAAGHAGEGRCNARDGVTPRARIDDAGERDQHHIGRIRGQIAHHRDESDGRCQEKLGRAADARPHGRAKQTGALGDPGPQHHNENKAQRAEARERIRHVDEKMADLLTRQKVLRLNDFVGDRIDGGNANGGGQRADHDDNQHEPGENQHRIGQRVARPLDPAEDALQLTRCLTLGHIASLSCAIAAPSRHRAGRPRPGPASLGALASIGQGAGPHPTLTFAYGSSSTTIEGGLFTQQITIARNQHRLAGGGIIA